MTDALHTAVASRDAMMRHHDPVRIQGYCSHCEKYGHFWSCPPFAEPPLDHFPVWTHAVIVCGKVWTKPEDTKEAMIARFFEARKSFRDTLVAREQAYIGVTALVAGFCTGCECCTRPDGIACRTPARLRYSLEAVGFDVTGIAENLAGQKLHWPKSGTPEYLMTVGALLCPDEAIARDMVMLLQ